MNFWHQNDKKRYKLNNIKEFSKKKKSNEFKYRSEFIKHLISINIKSELYKVQGLGF